MDYLKGYQLAIKNAQEFIEAADRIKDICYGKANALLILASEEAVKAGVLITKHHNPNQRIPDLMKYFRSHPHKHRTIKNMERFGSLMEVLQEVLIGPIEQAYSEKGKLNKNEANKLVDEGWDDLFDKLTKLVDNELSMTDLIIEKGMMANDEWWSNADKEKMRGFYLDYNDEKTDWKSPSDITEKEYNQSFKIVSGFVENIVLADEALGDEEFQKLSGKYMNNNHHK